MFPPDAAGTQAAVRAYWRGQYDAHYFATAVVKSVGPCAITTMERRPVYVCPAVFEDDQGQRRRAFVNLAARLPLGWTVVQFSPLGSE